VAPVSAAELTASLGAPKKCERRIPKIFEGNIPPVFERGGHKLGYDKRAYPQI